MPYIQQCVWISEYNTEQKEIAEEYIQYGSICLMLKKTKIKIFPHSTHKLTAMGITIPLWKLKTE